jgi:hypothetical protein
LSPSREAPGYSQAHCLTGTNDQPSKPGLAAISRQRTVTAPNDSDVGDVRAREGCGRWIPRFHLMGPLANRSGALDESAAEGGGTPDPLVSGLFARSWRICASRRSDAAPTRFVLSFSRPGVPWPTTCLTRRRAVLCFSGSQLGLSLPPLALATTLARGPMWVRALRQTSGAAPAPSTWVRDSSRRDNSYCHDLGAAPGVACLIPIRPEPRLTTRVTVQQGWAPDKNWRKDDVIDRLDRCR